MMRLSIIIISRNEERNIRRCIESALEGSENIGPKEILLVDSLSDDTTVEIAGEYPVRILQLTKNQRLTPSAGRYIGSMSSEGDFIQFLDGDMVLDKWWLAKAIPYLQERNAVAGVLGIMNEIYLREGHLVGRSDDIHRIRGRSRTNPRLVGGAILLKREVIQRIGSFNPHLFSHEDVELAFRMRANGLQLVSIPYPMVDHYSAPRGTLAEVIRRRRQNLHVGLGQSLRYHWKTPGVSVLLLNRRQELCLTAFALAGVGGLAISLLRQSLLPMLIWGLTWAIYVLSLVIRCGGFTAALLKLVEKGMYAVGTVKGFLLTPLPLDSYPKTCRKIQQHTV